MLLGEQFEQFLEAAPQRRQIVPASHAFAEAVGMARATDTNARWDKAFGSILRTLAVVDSWTGAVESDLNRFWNLDYRDRFRLRAD